MTLRNRLMALSLLTLLLPWSSWKLLQELERFLREAQENTLLSNARAHVSGLSFDSQRQLFISPQRYIVLRQLERAPVLDGFADDWRDAQHGLSFSSSDGELDARLLAGSSGIDLFLMFQVELSDAAKKPGPGAEKDTLEIFLRSPRGLLHFDIQPEAPGRVQLHSDNGGGQAEGFWRDTATGYSVELVIPALANNVDLDFTIKDRSGRMVSGPSREEADSGSDSGQQWLNLVAERDRLSDQLADSMPEVTQAWMVNEQGWVLARSGSMPERPQQQTTWLQRSLYRLVAGSRTRVEPLQTEPPVRLQSEVLSRALAGQESRVWTQDVDTAVVLNTVAVPIRLEGKVRGAVVLQSASENLLLVTNRALGRLVFTTLAITLGLAGGLWFFATRLSQRVRRLSGAVSEAMEDGVAADVLPLTSDRDELGELARNNARLLRAVADHNQYLQTLAGKLSHELKTPLAITRSSLDNLASQDLDSEAQRFVQRAQEGVDRQAAIVRAMSEANRLEASIRVAEWEQVDLAQLLNSCAEGYRAAHPGRKIETHIKPASIQLDCAPELVAQALDKLIDNAITMSADADVISMSLTLVESGVRLAVRNSGTKLPDEFQQKIFDSLVSLRDKHSQTPHLGLGLYIVRLVAEAHGGAVTARNLKGDKGVEFALDLPLSV